MNGRLRTAKMPNPSIAIAGGSYAGRKNIQDSFTSSGRLSSWLGCPTHEMQRPKICERFGSATRLKVGSHPIGGRDSIVTTGGGTLEVRLGTSGKRSPLWVRSTETISEWVLRAAPAQVTTAAKPVTARQLTTPITAIFLAA